MATVRRSRNFILLLLPVVALLAAPPALAARHRPLGACGAPAGSAINEYCDAIPSATGGTVPHVGSPSVATTLPKPIARAISAGPSAGRKLLTLPAAGKPHKPHKRKVRIASLSGPATSIWSLSLILILILAAIALGLVAIAVERRRRRTPPAA
jgi:hypothetical protein